MKKTVYRAVVMVLLFVMLVSSSVLLVSAAPKYTYNNTQLTQLDNAFRKHGYVVKQGFWANTKAVVKPVQTMLKELGYGSLSIDGIFGSATKKAVTNFQGKNKLAKDGCVGTKTWNKLVSAYRYAISKNTVSSATKARTIISFESISNPGTIQQGNGTHLSGTIKSSNSKLSTVTASVINSSGKTVLSKSVKLNAYSFKLYDSAVDWAISFGKLSAGSYTLKYVAKTADGTSNSKIVSFTVKAKITPKPTSASYSNSAPTVDIFVKQTPKKCTAASAAMLLRAKLAIQGKSYKHITLDTVLNKAWYSGLSFDFTIDGMHMQAYSLKGSAKEKENKVKELLKKHPEGIELYGWKGNSEHAVYMAPNGKILDPYGSKKYVNLSQSQNSASSQWSTINQYWIITN